MAKKTKTDDFPLNHMKAADVAKLYQVDPSAVSKWVSRDKCPRNADGTFDLAAVIAWREERLSAAAETEKTGGKSEELERWRRHRADLAELDLKFRRGQLLDRAEVERGRVERVQIVKAALLALPRLLPPILIGMEQREMTIAIRERVEAICREFAGQKQPARR